LHGVGRCRISWCEDVTHREPQESHMAETTIPRKHPKAPLNALEVRAALKHPPSGRYDRAVLREGGASGLTLRVGHDGIGSWTIEKKSEGRILRRLLGYSDKMTLSQARKKRDAVWSAILAGNDPVELRRNRMAARDVEREERKLKRLGYRGGANSLTALLDEF